MMAEFRSDHACMIQNSETDWMHARGQPTSARAWPAASEQLAGFHFQPRGTHPKVNMPPIIIAAGANAAARRAPPPPLAIC